VKVTAKRSHYEETKHHALLEKMNPCFGVELLKKLVTSEAYILYEVYAEDSFIGIFLAKLDKLIDGEIELVILHAAAVKAPAMPITSVLNPVFEAVAREHGIRSIRVHSDKKGLDKLLEENNFKFAEAIFRKVI